MKWYQPLECDNTVKNPLVCDYSNLTEEGFEESFFKKGIKVNEWNDDIYIQATKGKNDGIPDDVLQNYLMMPVFSERLVEKLKGIGIEGIQYLPIKVCRPNGECFENFYVANFINYVEAFDYDKSKYNRFSETFPNPNKRGKISGVMRFVLNEEKLKGYDIIRLKEYSQRFFVSERFKDVFVKNNFTGYSFEEIELN